MEQGRGGLLAVDVGLRTGMALFGADGKVRWFRSQHFARISGLKRRAHTLLGELMPLAWLVLEGGGPAADVWRREAERLGLDMLQTQAQEWRAVLLYGRERRTGAQAKSSASVLARRIIAWSGARSPTSLRHDAAEAVCIGFWGLLRVGVLREIPQEIRR